MWKNYTPPISLEGIEIPGDASVPPTHWWNLHILRQFYWKKVVVLQVSTNETLMLVRFRVGFTSSTGSSMINTALVCDPYFRMRVGHEDCTFFALNAEGTKEIPLRLVCITRITESLWQSTPLY